MKHVHVYILASRKNGVLYVGVTSDLARRLEQHRAPSPTAFTARYNVHRLVHVETYDDAETAIRREKRLKAGPRAWKIALFEGGNPEWADRADEMLRQVARDAPVKPGHDGQGGRRGMPRSSRGMT